MVRGHKPSEASKRSLHNLFERPLSEQTETEVEDPNLRYGKSFDPDKYYRAVQKYLRNDDCIVGGPFGLND